MSSTCRANWSGSVGVGRGTARTDAGGWFAPDLGGRTPGGPTGGGVPTGPRHGG
ncbi:hypothetical protein ACQP1S_26805 [Micromonospora matsumotoense]|uniref:hypothetical protein n=1 Tax=Micromonospora matsumotoense TaxID=121616 RepID=UPI003D8FC2D8